MLDRITTLLESVSQSNPTKLSPYEVSWLVINLWELDEESFQQFASYLSIDDGFNDQSIAPFVLANSYAYLKESKESESFGIQPNVSQTNIEEVVQKLFPRIDEINDVRVDEQQCAQISNWNDGRLRTAIAEIIASNDELDTDTRQTALEEAKKKHSGYEISDMDLPIKIRGMLHYVCLPFKTALETRGAVRFDVLSQLIRPYLDYQSASCIFITVDPCTVSLRNEINKAKSKGIPIQVIEGSRLCKLLAVYEKLGE